MKHMKKLLALGLTLVMFGTAGCGDTKNTVNTVDETQKKEIYRTVDEIKKDGTINIGVFSDKNPFGYVDENGTYQGYDVYFADRLAKDLGVKVN